MAKKTAIEVTTMEVTVEATSEEVSAEFLEKIEEECMENEKTSSIGKGGKRRHKGRGARRSKTADYKNRLKTRADSATKNVTKREEEDSKSKGYRIEKATGEKLPVTPATSRYSNISKIAGKYKTEKEKLQEQKDELQRVADGWKKKANEAQQKLETFSRSEDRFDEGKIVDLRKKADTLKAKAEEAQAAASRVIIPD